MSNKGNFFYIIWGMAITFIFGSFIVRPRSQAPLFFVTGIIFLIIAALYTRSKIKAPQRKAAAEKKKKLDEQIRQEQAEYQLAHMEGLAKYHKMDSDDARSYQEALAAMRQLGTIVQQSVYQEKEKDWAVFGGIADGIAGPAAGIITATNAIQDNAKIRAENVSRREWAANQNTFYKDLARQAERKSPVALSMHELQGKYEAVLSWAPSTLFSLIKTTDLKSDIDSQTGAVTVSVSWQQKDKSVCIDGALRAKLYTDGGECAGCAYLVLPKQGTIGFKGQLSGICACPKPSEAYTIKIEPMDLWELALKGNVISPKADNLTDAEHRRLVSDCEAKFNAELIK